MRLLNVVNIVLSCGNVTCVLTVANKADYLQIIWSDFMSENKRKWPYSLSVIGFDLLHDFGHDSNEKVHHTKSSNAQSVMRNRPEANNTNHSFQNTCGFSHLGSCDLKVRNDFFQNFPLHTER